MTEVTTPKGDKKPLHEIIDGLKEDDIEMLEPPKETLEFLNRYYNSITSKKIVANRYNDINVVKKYFNTKLHDIVNKDFIEKELPDVLKSTPILNKCMDDGKLVLLVSDYDCDKSA